MDDSLQKLYGSEIRFKKAVYYASLLSFIIVLLGVIGLVSLSAHKRTKEMGIRKVIGASVFNIITLFIKEFSVIVSIASLVAIPLAFYFMTKWLQNYAYKITITFTLFLISVIALISITFLLIGLLSLKTAYTTPIKSLKTE